MLWYVVQLMYIIPVMSLIHLCEILRIIDTISLQMYVLFEPSLLVFNTDLTGEYSNIEHPETSSTLHQGLADLLVALPVLLLALLVAIEAGLATLSASRAGLKFGRIEIGVGLAAIVAAALLSTQSND